ncbi:MAG: hypothetical protein H6586_02195 [Flavobacteriales bacterium]|nr:hypothetical protein [Flavobacteriales bacterium]
MNNLIIILFIGIVVIGCNNVNDKDKGDNTIFNLDTISYYKDYDRFTGKLQNQISTLENVDFPYIEVINSKGKPKNLKLFPSSDYINKPILIDIHFSEEGLMYTSQVSYDFGIYGKLYSIPLGNKVLSIDVTDKGMRGVRILEKIKEDSITHTMRWFRYVDFQMKNMSEGFADSVMKLSNFTHVWYQFYSFSSDNIMKMYSNNYDNKDSLIFTDTTCYNLKGNSFFWWSHNAKIDIIDCSK